MIENLQREDLNAIEKAIAFQDYLTLYGGTQEELAGRLGIDRSTVSNLIRLLDLPEEARQAVMEKKLTQGHARALLGLSDHAAILEAIDRIIREGLSVRQTEALVSTGEPTPAKPRIRKDEAEPGSTPSGGKPPHVIELEQHLQGRFGTSVLIKPRTAERGQIVIPFNSLEEYDRVTNLLRGH